MAVTQLPSWVNYSNALFYIDNSIENYAEFHLYNSTWIWYGSVVCFGSFTSAVLRNEHQTRHLSENQHFEWTRRDEISHSSDSEWNCRYAMKCNFSQFPIPAENLSITSAFFFSFVSIQWINCALLYFIVLSLPSSQLYAHFNYSIYNVHSTAATKHQSMWW